MSIPRGGLVCYHDLYDPSESLQVVPDLSGNGYDLTLKAASGAYDGDPSWADDGLGLKFNGEGYCSVDPVTDVPIKGPWTALVVGDIGSHHTAGTIWNAANRSLYNNYLRFHKPNASNWQLHLRFDAISAAASSSIVNPPEIYNTNPALVKIAAVPGGNMVADVLMRDGAGRSATVDNVAPDSVAAGLSIGTVLMAGNYTGTYANGFRCLSHLFYDHVLSDAETIFVASHLHSLWASRGVDILYKPPRIWWRL